MEAVEGLSPSVGVSVACRALGVARATLYRHRRRHDRRDRPRPRRPTPARALSGKERDAVLEVLHTPQFVDRSPAQAYATLLDDNTYLCSVRIPLKLNARFGESERAFRGF